jgi:putative ABC transport system permease protein
MLENINLAFQGVWSHKLRSFLTMLGIIIGIAAIITIVSTIKGTNEQIKQNLIGAGNNVVNVTLMQDNNQMDFSYASVPQGISMITSEMRDEIDKLDKVQESSLYYSRSWADGVYVGNSSFNGNIYGGDSHFLSVEGYMVNYGRGFIDSDFTTGRKVVLIDANTAQSLFQGQNPIGGTIEIKGEPFVVVGVVSQKTTSEPVINSVNDYYMYSGNTSGVIIIPDACWPIVYRYDEPLSVAVRATSTNDMTEAGNNVAKYLNENVVSTDKCKYQAKDLLQQAADLQSLSETTNKQLIWIAAISLVVGGIGVMNIMLVSVTERTREIGLKIAIGAQQSRILWQFLTEAAVLTSLGGILGVACGIGLAYMLSSIMGTPVAISVGACAVAVAFSMIIGVVFGLMPAVKASKLNPIEALRRE